MKILLFLLFTTLCFSQNNGVNLHITNISTQDTLKYFTKYSVDYELKNSSDKDALFFNSTDNPLELNYRKTTSIYADYNIYDDKVKLNEKLFTTNKSYLNIKHYIISSEGKSEVEQKIYQDSIKKALANHMKYNKVDFEKKRDSAIIVRIKQLNLHNDFDYVKNSLITLKPNESIKGTLNFFWYKKKYRKIDDEEFYLDENPKQIEVTLQFSKPIEMKRYFTSEEFKKIENNPNFIFGTFVSDKIAVSFKD